MMNATSEKKPSILGHIKELKVSQNDKNLL